MTKMGFTVCKYPQEYTMTPCENHRLHCMCEGVGWYSHRLLWGWEDCGHCVVTVVVVCVCKLSVPPKQYLGQAELIYGLHSQDVGWFASSREGRIISKRQCKK